MILTAFKAPLDYLSIIEHLTDGSTVKYISFRLLCKQEVGAYPKLEEFEVYVRQSSEKESASVCRMRIFRRLARFSFLSRAKNSAILYHSNNPYICLGVRRK